MSQVSPDQPDYQRGVVSAQKQLAAETGGTVSATVGVPPNAETLVVSTVDAPVTTYPTCVGVTTGQEYAGFKAVPQPGKQVGSTWFFDVSSAQDDQVSITFNVAPPKDWYVYADAGVHVVVDAAKYVDLAGLQYVVSSVPSTAAGIHPPVELSLASNSFTANGNLLPAPGAGKRYRVFGGQITVNAGSGVVGLLLDTGDNNVLMQAVFGVGGQLVIPGQGYPCSTDAALKVELSAAGTVAALLYYITETV